jgi:hypothetical protein
MCWSLFSSMVRRYGVKEWEHLVSKVRQLSTHSKHGQQLGWLWCYSFTISRSHAGHFLNTRRTRISALCFFSLALRILAFHNLA